MNAKLFGRGFVSFISLFRIAVLVAVMLAALASPAGFLTISPQAGTAHSVVNISGGNFDPTPTNNLVLFGAVRATVVTASTTNLTVLVPTGATFAPVTVSVGAVTSQSNQRFLPTFAGLGVPVTSSSFVAQSLSTESGPFQLVIADLDGDGKPDLVLANVYAHTISILRNIGSPGLLSGSSFAPAFDLPVGLDLAAHDNPVGLEVADVDGDGKLDILVCDRSVNKLLICRNQAIPGILTPDSFAPPVALPTGNDPRHVRVADLDGDGLQDLVVTSYGDNAISIFQNIGAPGSLTTNSFAPRLDLPAGSGGYDVAIADFDGDGKPDIAMVNGNATFISVLRNTSTPGTLDTSSFATEVDFPSPVACDSILAVDVDGDSQLDLVVGSIQGEVMSVLRNLSSPGTLAFDTHVDFGAPGWVHNVAVADFTGDSKPDLAIDGELNSYMAVFENGSVPGGFSTSSLSNRVDFASGYNAWGIAVGDLDGDGRPDIVFANTYDNTLTLYRNLVPKADSPYRFDWNSISSPRFTTAPFPVTILAHNATNGIVTNFSGVVSLTSTNGIAVTPPISGNFIQGVWTGLVRIAQPAANMVLQADDGTGAVGLSNPFNVQVPPALATIPVGNYLLLFWSTNSAGFVLESTAGLSPAQWAPVAGAPTPISDQFMEAVQTLGHSRFYRLRYTGP